MRTMMRAVFCLLLGTTLTLQASEESPIVQLAHPPEPAAVRNATSDMTAAAAELSFPGCPGGTAPSDDTGIDRAGLLLQAGSSGPDNAAHLLQAGRGVVPGSGHPGAPHDIHAGELKQGAVVPSVFARGTTAAIARACMDGQPERTAWIARGWLGVRIVTMTDEQVDAAGLAGQPGVLIVIVDKVSPATDAGIVPGDVVLQVDGEPVTRWQALAAALGSREPGTAVRLQIWRNHTSLDVRATLSFWPAALDLPDRSPPGPE
jgi:hypothetical protein